MLFRIFLTAVVGLFFGAVAGGGWWLMHRKPDPSIHAALLASKGDMRETLLLERSAVASNDKSAEARLGLAQSLLKVNDGAAAEKGFRVAKNLGADKWVVLQGIGEAEQMQSHWQAMLDDLPDTSPVPAVTAKLLLLRGTAHLGLGQLPAARTTLAAAEAAVPGEANTLLLSALVARAAGDIPGARAKADAALQKDPTLVEAVLLKLRTTNARTDLAGALALADRAIEVAPWMIVPRLERANLLMLSGKDAKAQEDVDTVLSRLPRMPTAQYLNAVLLARAGKYLEASAAFQRLGAVAERFPRALYIESVIASRLGNRDTAEGFATRYNTRFPGERDGILLLAKAHLAANRADLAVPLLEQAIAAERSSGGAIDPAFLSLLGDAYAGLGRTSDALRVRQEAAAIAPDNAAILNGLGMSQLGQGDVSAALDTLGHAAELAPPPDAVSTRLFAAALAVGDIDRASTTLAQRRAAEGQTEAVGTMAAMLLVGKGDIEGARRAFEGLRKTYPDAVGPQVGLARVLVAEGHPTEASTILQGVLAKEPANTLAFAAQLQIWIAAKNFEPALRAAQAAEIASPTDPRFTAAKAELMILSGDPKGALTMLEDRRGTGTLPPVLLVELAKAQEATGSPDAALATFATMLAAAPGNFEVRFAQVNLLLAQKRIEDAKASLRAGLAASPGVYGAMRALVVLETRTGGLDAGLKVAAELRAQPTAMPAAAFLQGDLLMEAKQFDRAAQAFQDEFTKAPGTPLALRLATAQVAAGHIDAATAGLHQWSDTHPNDPDVAGLLAKLEVGAGHWDQATTELERRLQRRPNDAAALNDLAWIYQTKNDPRALALAQHAYQISPVAQIADTLGWIMLQHGDTAPALSLLQKASAQRPDDPALAYHLAVAYQKSGKPEDARKALEPVLARPAPFDDRPAAETLLRELAASR
jgi:putative PEP-CTERM system TPR-repeat lipoprotein